MQRKIKLLTLRRKLARLSLAQLKNIDRTAATLSTGQPYIVIDRVNKRRWEIYDSRSPWLAQ